MLGPLRFLPLSEPHVPLPRNTIPCLLVLFLGVTSTSRADGPKDNQAESVRPIPPIGDAISKAVSDTLLLRCEAIRAQWQTLRDEAAKADSTNNEKKRKPSAAARIDRLASEVLVFPRAVELAIEFQQFYKPRDPEVASQLLDEAIRRLKTVKSGGDWADVVGLSDGSKHQLIVGGFQSKIDGSFQPYGLVVPSGLSRGDVRPRRLDIWFHGRGETLSEVGFLAKQQVDPGQYTPSDTFVLHPYGRYCNAFKFAGEVDVLEVLEYVQEQLPIDSKLISVRGFSMGGAACWQFATHHADRWFAANPGAGFSETPKFLNFFQGENVRQVAPDYQQKLWDLYDCPAWAVNLSQCPTVAYSGEVDRQKQAADVMEARLKELNIDLLHVIGPDTAHKIHPDSKVEIESRMNSLAQRATSSSPRSLVFTTLSLRYHQMHWIDVRGLQEHWMPATVKASHAGNEVKVSTQNVSRIRFVFEAGQWRGNPHGEVKVLIDGDEVKGPMVRSDRSWQWELMRRDGHWVASDGAEALTKRPELQGPIDDAFMDSFLFVLPSGKSKDQDVQNWVDSEAAHAMNHWRKHFRGDVRHKLDHQVTDEDIQSGNLITFGDADSNELIRRVRKSLPLEWNDQTIRLGSAEVPATGHVPVLIYPNPLNADRYIVINSGFTYREYDYLNNARQTPKLPDWALIDIRVGATTRDAGAVKAAGFFDEDWQP